MLVYKNIVRLIANTDKNYFLLGSTQNTNKKRFQNKNKNKKNVSIKSAPIKSDNKWIMSLLFKMMITQLKGCDIKFKYKVFKDLLTNFLIVNSREETENFKQMFYKIQRLYNILNRFVYNYKFKRAKIVVNSDNKVKRILPSTKILDHEKVKRYFATKDPKFAKREED